MSRVIAVANQKGGVGKTTTVINLGAALSQRNRKVLLVDLDPQAALTAASGFDPYHLKQTTYSVLMGEHLELPEIMRPLGDSLWLAPASVDLAAAEYSLYRLPNRTDRLRESMNIEVADIVLIDTPPSLGLMTVNALVAADEVLIPVGCQYLALRGLRALLETLWMVQDRLQPELKFLGILPTLYQANSIHSRGVIRELRSTFGEWVFNTVIAMDEAIAIAPTARKSVLAFQPESPAADAFRQLAEEVLQKRSIIWGKFPPR